MYSRLSKQTSKFQFSFGKNKIRTLPLRNCRSRFEKISNNLLLKVSYRFFLHNLLVFFSLLLSSCLVSKSYCGTKTTETRPFHRWSMVVPVNETAIAVSVKKHGWLCKRVVQDVLIDPGRWQLSTEQPRHLQLATVGQQRNVGQQSRVVTSNIFFSRHEADDNGGGASKM